MYRSPPVLDIQAKARTVLAGLFAAYRARPELLPEQWRVDVSTRPTAIRRIGDFIAGMTDRYAIGRYRELIGPVELPEGFEMRVVLVGGTASSGPCSPIASWSVGEANCTALLRNPSGRDQAGWREHIAPVSEWPRIVGSIAAQVAISALGTTMRAAGSQAAFRAVDHDAVVAFASAARDAGARHMMTVSSAGADRHSRNFYLKLKGEVEHELSQLDFERLDIFRPGLLRGPRGGDRRVAERLGIAVSPADRPVHERTSRSLRFDRGEFGRRCDARNPGGERGRGPCPRQPRNPGSGAPLGSRFNLGSRSSKRPLP
jgi:hypothetical protein